jgi:DNA polymerase-1
MKKLVLIDSNAVIHRAYHALPKTMSNRKGEMTNAVYGFTTTLIKILEDLKPEYVAASFDVSKKTFRHEQYVEYKAHRVAADQELYDQMPRVREILSALNIPIYEKEGFEADDCIGTIADKFEKRHGQSEMEVYVVTGDKDLFQLVDGNIFVYSLKKGLSQLEIVDRKKIKEEYGLDPEDFVDLKALAGDASDNIPGVPGIGPKTATTLIQTFDSLEGLYQSIEAVISTSNVIPVKTGIQDSNSEDSRLLGNDSLDVVAKGLGIKARILNLLIEHKDQAFLSQKLATIHKEVPIDFDIEDCKWGEYDKTKLQALFEELGFHSLLRRFGAEPQNELKTKKAEEQKKKDEQLKLL